MIKYKTSTIKALIEKLETLCTNLPDSVFKTSFGRQIKPLRDKSVTNNEEVDVWFEFLTIKSVLSTLNANYVAREHFQEQLQIEVSIGLINEIERLIADAPSVSATSPSINSIASFNNKDIFDESWKDQDVIKQTAEEKAKEVAEEKTRKTSEKAGSTDGKRKEIKLPWKNPNNGDWYGTVFGKKPRVESQVRDDDNIQDTILKL